MITLKSHQNIHISGQIIFSEGIKTFGFADQALWQRSADSYEKAIEQLFASIEKTATGRAVLRAIDRTAPRAMMVEPILHKPPGLPDAFAGAVDLKAARRRGSDTCIGFTPAHWTPTTNMSHRTLTGAEYYYGPGAQPDEVLLHEVVHGLRHMAGLRMTRNVPFQSGYDKFEEFYAILIANIYRSELRRPDLRTDHRSFKPLESIGIKTQEDFYDYRLNKWHLEKLQRQQPSLFFDLQAVKAKFNPTTLVTSKAKAA